MPTSREIESALRVLESLRRSIDAEDAAAARLHPGESSWERHHRWKESRLIDRLASIDDTAGQLRRWLQQQRQQQGIRPGHGS